MTLEIDPHHADVARASVDNAGLGNLVDVRVGPATAGLAQLVDEGSGPFDLVFIDADKMGYPDYFTWSLQLARPGALIIADNVVRNGAIIDPATTDPNVQGVRVFLEQMAAEPRVTATVVQTVGMKGYDGFAIALVLE